VSGASEETTILGGTRKRAVIRLVLGQLQIMGATAGLLLLVQTGVTDWTVGIVAATGLVGVASRLSFRDTSS